MNKQSVFAPKYTQKYEKFEKGVLDKRVEIEAWFRERWHENVPPFYGSIDLRNNGYKMVSVDMNLFPGGFNNLNPNFMPLGVAAVEDAIERRCPSAKNILIVPENHTRNTFYLQNVFALKELIEQAGFNVRLGTINPEIENKLPLETALGDHILLEKLMRTGDKLHLADGFTPCLTLLNNDLSGGIPDILKGVKGNIAPSIHAGWSTRRKTQHFRHYEAVTKDFAEAMGMDPWQFSAYYSGLGNINFQDHTGEEQLADAIAELLKKIQKKYDEEGIEEQPYVIVKADAGTYGMGVMSVRDPKEVIGLNRKNRNKMSTVKEGLNVTEVMIQEGVYTAEKVGESVAEPVVYMMDRYVIGGFYRVHDGRKADENLNASGMTFTPLTGAIPMPEFKEMEKYEGKRHFETWDEFMLMPDCSHPNCQRNRHYLYGVIGRLAMLAASKELKEVKEKYGE